MEAPVVNAVPSSYNVTKVKPPAVAAYKRRFVQPASSTAAATGGTYVRIPIPTGQAGTFLDPHRSFLQFKLSLTSAFANGFRFAGLAGASACIQELRLYCSGQVVSEILNYNNVAEVVNDVTSGSGRSHLNTLCTGAYTVNTIGDPATALLTATVGYSTSFNGDVATAGPNNIAFTRTFTIPLIDGWVGLMAEKAFPTMLVAPGTLELEIKFATDAVAFESGAALVAAASYTNIAFVGEQVIIHSDVADAVLAAAQSGLLMYSTGYHTYQSTIAAATAGSFIIPARALSANSFFWSFRDTAGISTQANFGLRRINPSVDISDANYKTFWLTIGTENVPQRSIQSYTEAFGELSKALGIFSSKDAALSKCFYFGSDAAGGYAQRTVCTFASMEAATGCYLEGLDLDVFSLSSAEVRSGRNLQADQITYYWQAGGAVTACSVDTILMHDVRLQFLPGGSLVPVY